MNTPGSKRHRAAQLLALAEELRANGDIAFAELITEQANEALKEAKAEAQETLPPQQPQQPVEQQQQQQQQRQQQEKPKDE